MDGNVCSCKCRTRISDLKRLYHNSFKLYSFYLHIFTMPCASFAYTEECLFICQLMLLCFLHKFIYRGNDNFLHVFYYFNIAVLHPGTVVTKTKNNIPGKDFEHIVVQYKLCYWSFGLDRNHTPEYTFT